MPIFCTALSAGFQIGPTFRARALWIWLSGFDKLKAGSHSTFGCVQDDKGVVAGTERSGGCSFEVCSQVLFRKPAPCSMWSSAAGYTTSRSMRHGLAPRLQVGDSIAVSGVCLTALAIAPEGQPERFEADLAEETVRRTSLSRLAAGTVVNLSFRRLRERRSAVTWCRAMSTAWAALLPPARLTRERRHRLVAGN